MLDAPAFEVIELEDEKLCFRVDLAACVKRSHEVAVREKQIAGTGMFLATKDSQSWIGAVVSVGEGDAHVSERMTVNGGTELYGQAQKR